MNTYEGNLRESVAQTLGALSNEEAALQHGVIQGQLGLYYAQGETLATKTRLVKDQKHCESRRHAHHAVQHAHQQGASLQESIQLAQQGSDSAVGNVATTASNLQISADAIMELASTVGAAMNVASAAVYDSELFHHISRINTHLNQVANQARFLALQGMEVSGRCAEGIAGALIQQGSDVQARMDELLARMQSDLDHSEAAVQAGHRRLGVVNGAECSAKGELRDVTARADAMRGMLVDAVRHTNMGLHVKVTSCTELAVRFSPFKAPFASNGGQALPDPQARSYLAVVPQNRADVFSSDQAAQLFGKWDGQATLFTAVQPGESTITLTLDVYGNPVQPGKPYCAFLYTEPSAEYKRQLGNYGDHLSIASAPFVPLTPLPAVVTGGVSATPCQLLMYWPAQGQGRSTPAENIAALTAATAQLTPWLDWLSSNGAALEPGTAERLDAVVPPLGSALQAAVAALNAGESTAAGNANTTAQSLLTQLAAWPALDPQEPHATELGELCEVLRALGPVLTETSEAAESAQQGIGEGLELRCILLDSELAPDLTECAQQSILPQCFNAMLAEQVAPANYLIAQFLAEPPATVAQTTETTTAQADSPAATTADEAASTANAEAAAEAAPAAEATPATEASPATTAEAAPATEAASATVAEAAPTGAAATTVAPAPDAAATPAAAPAAAGEGDATASTEGVATPAAAPAAQGSAQTAAPAKPSGYWFNVNIPDDATDNYGNPLQTGHRYIPFVLAVASGSEQQAWANSLSIINAIWQAN